MDADEIQRQLIPVPTRERRLLAKVREILKTARGLEDAHQERRRRRSPKPDQVVFKPEHVAFRLGFNVGRLAKFDEDVRPCDLLMLRIKAGDMAEVGDELDSFAAGFDEAMQTVEDPPDALAQVAGAVFEYERIVGSIPCDLWCLGRGDYVPRLWLGCNILGAGRESFQFAQDPVAEAFASAYGMPLHGIQVARFLKAATKEKFLEIVRKGSWGGRCTEVALMDSTLPPCLVGESSQDVGDILCLTYRWSTRSEAAFQAYNTASLTHRQWCS